MSELTHVSVPGASLTCVLQASPSELLKAVPEELQLWRLSTVLLKLQVSLPANLEHGQS